MEADYKIVQQEERNGAIVYQRVRFYEGETSTQDEFNPITGVVEPINRYRRADMIEEVEYYYE